MRLNISQVQVESVYAWQSRLALQLLLACQISHSALDAVQQAFRRGTDNACMTQLHGDAMQHSIDEEAGSL